MRYVNTIERSWRRSCAELAKLQKARLQAEAEEAAAEAARIGSVLQAAAAEQAQRRHEELAAEITAQVIAIKAERRVQQS